MSTEASPESTSSITRPGCVDCYEVESNFPIHHPCQNLFIVHTHRTTIKNKKTNDKQNLLHRIEKVVAALRNCSGGILIIHLQGTRECDRYLEYFDEFISRRFEEFTEDGQLYVDTYTRHWLSKLPTFRVYKDFLLISVEKSSSLVTVDFNTKVSTDVEKLNPSSLHIGYLLKKAVSDTEPPVLKGIPTDIDNLHESRHVEIKVLSPKLLNYETLLNSIPVFVDYVWSGLKLKDNITAISKVSGGGSYYVGIGEKQIKNGDYETKIPEISGFELNVDKDRLRVALLEKIHKNTCVLNQNIYSDSPLDLTDIAFHQLPETKPQRYVLEVAIRHFDGIVFSDKEGPRTYTIVDGQTVRLDKKEWLCRLKQAVDL